MNNFDMSFLPSMLKFCRCVPQIGSIGLGLGLGIGGVLSVSIMSGYPAQAQSSAQSQSSNVDVQFIPLPISSYDIGGVADRGAPDGRQAAGTRGPCFPQFRDGPSSQSAESPELTVMLPTVPISYGDETVHAPMGSTARSHPTFLFYTPYTQQVVEAMQFTLMDADDYPVANIDVPVPEEAGLLNIAWPMDQFPLATEVEYRWLLLVDCRNPLQPTDSFTDINETFTADLVVEGFIRRFSHENHSDSGDNRDSHEAISLDTIAQLAASGLWNDALHDLFSQLSDHPQPDTISIALGQLLASVGLEDFIPYMDMEGS